MLGNEFFYILWCLRLFIILFFYYTLLDTNKNSACSNVGKIGYGTVSEALAYKLPFVFVRRDYFNEEPFLRNMLEVETSQVLPYVKTNLKFHCRSSTLSEVMFCVLFCSITKQHYQCGIEMIRRDLLTGHWKPYLLRAITLQPCYDGPINGGKVISTYCQIQYLYFKYYDNSIQQSCFASIFTG